MKQHNSIAQETPAVEKTFTNALLKNKMHDRSKTKNFIPDDGLCKNVDQRSEYKLNYMN